MLENDRGKILLLKNMFHPIASCSDFKNMEVLLYVNGGVKVSLPDLWIHLMLFTKKQRIRLTPSNR